MTTTLTWINPNDTFLTQSQQLNNAQIVAYHFKGTDWTKESISALCGNMAHESSLNPDMHELGYNDSPSRGYGLVQWTPMTKYTDWASAAGLPWDSGDSQLARIDYEVNNNIQWVPDGLQARYGMGDKYNFSFSDFRKNTPGLSVDDLTEAFMWNYEGPSYSAGTSSLASRQSFANLCLSSLDWTGTGGGITPPPYTSHVQSVATSAQYQYEEKGEIGMYVQVKSGDTLSGIAARYGVNMNGIKQVVFQDIPNKDVIGVGEVLLLPNAAAPTPAPQPVNVNVNPQYYWIVPGDYLGKIAQQFGTTISQLQAWNNISNLDKIFAGQRLRVR